MKTAKDLLRTCEAAKEDPILAGKKQLKDIEDVTDDLNTLVKNLKVHFEKQFTKEPTSWAGIGHGGDLEHIFELVSSAVRAIQSFKMVRY